LKQLSAATRVHRPQGCWGGGSAAPGVVDEITVEAVSGWPCQSVERRDPRCCGQTTRDRISFRTFFFELRAMKPPRDAFGGGTQQIPLAGLQRMVGCSDRHLTRRRAAAHQPRSQVAPAHTRWDPAPGSGPAQRRSAPGGARSLLSVAAGCITCNVRSGWLQPGSVRCSCGCGDQPLRLGIRDVRRSYPLGWRCSE